MEIQGVVIVVKAIERNASVGFLLLWYSCVVLERKKERFRIAVYIVVCFPEEEILSTNVFFRETAMLFILVSVKFFYDTLHTIISSYYY